MLNLLTKTKPWMVASLFVATSLFGQSNTCPTNACKPCPPKPCPPPCPQPCPPTQVCPGQDPCCPPWATPVLNAAYNYPARIQTRCPWDFFVDASFIYWQPLLENLELGFVNNETSEGFLFDGSYINQKFQYKPGFKVSLGMGFDYDNWDSHLVYTWFHGTHSTNASVNFPDEVIFPQQGNALEEIVVELLPIFNSANQGWRLNMDFLDWDLGRWHYVGTKLLFRPAFGVRAAWIRQKINSTYNSLEDAVSLAYSARTNSWAVGPRAGLETTWMLGEGFRLFGNGAADILYTRYTKLNSTTSVFVLNEFVSGTSESQSKLGYLRPHLELQLGLGWGTYLDCNNWYMDFAAGYGFQVFYNQNMFRTSTDHSFMPNGDLFVHGLDLTFRLDF